MNEVERIADLIHLAWLSPSSLRRDFEEIEKNAAAVATAVAKVEAREELLLAHREVIMWQRRALAAELALKTAARRGPVTQSNDDLDEAWAIYRKGLKERLERAFRNWPPGPTVLTPEDHRYLAHLVDEGPAGSRGEG